MKGVIFNVLEDFVTETFGDEVYEEILASCVLQTTEPFVGPASYPDADLFTLVQKTTERLGISAFDAMRGFGKYALPKFAAKVPMFMRDHHHPKSFLMTVDNIIHVEVRKLFKDADPPRIIATDASPETLILTYESKRSLCGLMEGLLDGTAEFFAIPIHYTQRRCKLRGASDCEFLLTFDSPLHAA